MSLPPRPSPAPSPGLTRGARSALAAALTTAVLLLGVSLPGAGCTTSTCGQLMDCCADVDAPAGRINCIDIAEGGVERFCGNKLEALLRTGLCGPGKDQVITPGPDTPTDGSECRDLEACCATLDAATRASCQILVTQQGLIACRSAHRDLQRSGRCPGGDGGIDAGDLDDLAGDQSLDAIDAPEDAKDDAVDAPVDAAGDAGDGPMSQDTSDLVSSDGGDLAGPDGDAAPPADLTGDGQGP